MEIKRGIEQAVDVVVEELRKLSREVRGKTEISQVGTISANNDRTVGDLIAEAMEKVGKDGVITVEEGKTPRPRWMSSRECSLTVAIFPPTS